jgi:predicted Zn-dependent protease with MMP-like domain
LVAAPCSGTGHPASESWPAGTGGARPGRRIRTHTGAASGERRDLIRSVAVQTGKGGARPAVGGPQPRRRDRHGRGLRGRLVPPEVPLYRSRSQQFDEIVLEAVARLEPRWESELSDVEFAVQEVPDSDIAGAEGVPLARIVRGSTDTSDPQNPATGPRIVLFRRPLMARAEDEDELSELVFDVVVEELAEILGVDPETIDPGYGDFG